MKIINYFAVTILMALCIGCSNGSKFEGNFSGNDLKAVKLTEKSLPGGAVMEDCRVVTEKLPLALLDTEYKSVRDKVNKARIDYRTCMTRGLDAAALKNVETLVEIQNLIQDKSRSLKASSPEYLFVLAKARESSAGKEGIYGYIGVFDPHTLEQVDFIQVTTPLLNNAVMQTEALNGTLANPTANSDGSSLKSDNPIVEFILSCTPK